MWTDENLIKILKENGVVVMPTDTIYGILGRAENKKVVNRIYELRKRNPEKPYIILIGNIGELEKFSIILSEEQKEKLNEYWFTSKGVGGLRSTSIIFDCEDEKFIYLHRGTYSLAFRLPHPQELRELLLKVGPLIAPSANTEKFPASENISDAKAYFGDTVDPVRGREGSQRASTSNGVNLYIDGGEIVSKASRVIKLHKDGTVSILRE